MIKIIMMVLICHFSQSILAKDPIPQWFIEDLNNNIGTWITDNSAYQTDKEPQESYVMQWQWGIGKTSITGKLYGIIDGEPTADYWHFRQYWNNSDKKALLIQFGNGGVIGFGEIKPTDVNTIQSIQEFSLPDGTTWSTKHISKMNNFVLDSRSFDQDTKGNWIKSRAYIWHKKLQ